MKTSKRWILVFSLLVILLVVGCDGGSSVFGVTPTPTVTMTSTPTSTRTPTITPTITPTFTPSPTPTEVLVDYHVYANEFYVGNVNVWKAECVPLSIDELPYALKENQEVVYIPITNVADGSECNFLLVINLPENYVERGFPDTDGYFTYKYYEIEYSGSGSTTDLSSYNRTTEDTLVYLHVLIPSYYLEIHHSANFRKE